MTHSLSSRRTEITFLQHLNSIHPKIKFTCEEIREDGSMPFLDILVTPEEDGSLKTSVFRKTTHTDLYLQLDSHHTIPSKYSVAGILYHRASTVAPPPTVAGRRRTPLQSSQKMQIPHMGHKKGKNEEPEPKQEQNKKNPNWPEQQQNKLVHGSPIPSRTH